MAPAMLQGLPDTPLWIVADRGYSSDAIRTQVWDMNARPAIPAKRNEAAQRCPDFIYVSIGLEIGPHIGVQLGPLFGQVCACS